MDQSKDSQCKHSSSNDISAVASDMVVGNCSEHANPMVKLTNISANSYNPVVKSVEFISNSSSHETPVVSFNEAPASTSKEKAPTIKSNEVVRNCTEGNDQPHRSKEEIKCSEDVDKHITKNDTINLDKEMSAAVFNVITQIVMNHQEKEIEIQNDSSATTSKEEIVDKICQDGSFHCDKCARVIKRKDNFKRHYWKVHKLRYHDNSISNNTKNICIFPGCSEVYYHKSRMIEHLKSEHNVSVEVDNKKFDSHHDFFTWKMKEECQNFVCFVKRDERRISSNVSYSSFVCQHDGTSHKTTGTKRLRKKSVKKDLICPARMLVRHMIDTDVVLVKYVKSHNHKITYEDVRKHPLPQSVRNNIKEKLLLNKSVDDVYSELHQEAHDENMCEENITAIRKVLVDKSKIQYIQKKLNLPKNCKENKLLIEDRLKALTSDNFNPILLYKPEGLVIETDNEVGNQEDDVTFIFALQTKEQQELFQKYANKIVFLELTQPTSNIPYYILTVKVIDDMLQGYNVAHLITNVTDDDIAQIFFNEMKSRCTDLKIKVVMTTLDNYGLKAFEKVFGHNIHFIYSKWHLHEMLFTKLLTDYPLEEELRQQVYFTLVALVEELDREQFQSIVSDFVHLYKDRCPIFVAFLTENYLNKPENWALCYREPSLRRCDIVMNGNILLSQLKSVIKLSKDVCSIGELLHAILNINQACYLKQKCKQTLSDAPCSNHDIGLLIPDADVSKISDSQWIVLVDRKTYEINWNSDGCLEMFCQIRCLELVCFGLCKHMYTCNCDERTGICSHVHKVHALETGVCRFQCVFGDKDDDRRRKTKKTEFSLHKHLTSNSQTESKQKTLSVVGENLNRLEIFMKQPFIQDQLLSEVDNTLKILIKKCELLTSENNKRKDSQEEIDTKRHCSE